MGEKKRSLCVAKGQGKNPEIRENEIEYNQDIFLTILNKVLRVKFPLSRKKALDYIQYDEQDFSDEEKNKLINICKEDDGFINGNIYLRGIEAKYSFIDWFEEERGNIEAYILQEILTENKQDIEKVLNEEQQEELKKIKEFISNPAAACFKLIIK